MHACRQMYYMHMLAILRLLSCSVAIDTVGHACIHIRGTGCAACAYICGVSTPLQHTLAS